MFEAFLLGGIALNTFAQLQANDAEAQAERENQRFFELQKQQSELATARSAEIFEFESEMFLGDQISSFARAGVDISGSALLTIAGTKRQQGNELAAILQEGKTTTRLAQLRADQSRRNADRLGSFETRAMTIAGGVLQGGGALLGSKKPGGGNMNFTTNTFNNTPRSLLGVDTRLGGN